MAHQRLNQEWYAGDKPTVAVLSSSRAAFSLFDLLVSIAVMAVLIAILMPSLAKAQESARRVKCAGQMQQVGYAMEMYANQWRQHLPPAIGIREDVERMIKSIYDRNDNNPDFPEWQADTMKARAGAPTSTFDMPADSTPSVVHWEGLGVLVHRQYLNHPEACYCPSHHGEHPHSRYASNWRNGTSTIRINYQYRVPGISAFRNQLNPRTTIVTDGMETKLDFSHVRGSNTLKVDGSVGWFFDGDGSLYESLPDDLSLIPGGKTGENGNRNPAWKRIDEQGSRSRRPGH